MLTLSEAKHASSVVDVFDSEVWSSVLNSDGEPRLSVARKVFLPLSVDRIPLAVECYSFWRDFSEYMLIDGSNVMTGDKLFLAVKCSKRGNDVFARRLDARLGFFNELGDIVFFRAGDFDKAKAVHTRLLWVTLTYDAKRCSLHDAWENISEEYNLWITKIRKKYGRVSVLKFFQPFDDVNGSAYGYPHVHLVMMFHDYEFSVFPHLVVDGDKKVQNAETGRGKKAQSAETDGDKTCLKYCVQETEGTDGIKEVGGWHSFVDVSALSSMRAVVNYCKKYAEGACYGSSDKASLTNAISWLYRKQSYSMSSDFKKVFLEFIKGLQSSNHQLCLDGSVLQEWVWKFCGIVSGRVFGGRSGGGDRWVLELDADEFKRLLPKKRRLFCGN